MVHYQEWIDYDLCDYFFHRNTNSAISRAVFTGAQLNDVVNVIRMSSKALMNTGYDEDPNFLAYFYHSNNGTQSVVKIKRFSVVPIYAKPVLPHYYDVIR